MGIHKDKSLVTAADELRSHAEERLQTKTAGPQPPRTKEALQRLVHELEVHQIELEMQNEELNQARDEVEDALEKYTDLYDFSPAGYLTLDSAGAIRAVNLTGAGFLGVERSRLIGRHLGQFVTQEHRPAFAAFLATVVTSRGNGTFEAALLNEGDLPRIVQIEALATPSGQECRLALIDITGRRQAEAALKESEERMYRLAEMAADAIIMLDESGAVTFCNAAAESMFGCSDVGTSHCEFHRNFIPEQFRIAAKQGLDYFGKQGSGEVIGKTTEVIALRKDGSEFPMELTISALKIQGTWHAIGIMRDVTERKQLEAEVLDAREYAETIINTVRRPLVVLDSDLKIISANRSFYYTFKTKPEETIGNFIHGGGGNRQWDIPKLRDYLEGILKQDTVPTCCEIGHDFFDIGHRVILFNARRIFRENSGSYNILLAMEDITSRKHVEVKLRHDSTHDMLTGLYNRAFFDEELERLVHGRIFPLSIVMADVNDLKTVNDTLGHEAGDTLIRSAARIILGAFRAEDIVARIGGDEFAVLLPGAGKDTAEEAIKRIMSSPEIINGHVSIAFGIATAENREQLADAIRLSDERMYRHKSEQKRS